MTAGVICQGASEINLSFMVNELDVQVVLDEFGSVHSDIYPQVERGFGDRCFQSYLPKPLCKNFETLPHNLILHLQLLRNGCIEVSVEGSGCCFLHKLWNPRVDLRLDFF